MVFNTTSFTIVISTLTQLFSGSEREDYLHQLALKGMKALAASLFEIPAEPVEEGRIIELPKSVTKLPREKPVYCDHMLSARWFLIPFRTRFLHRKRRRRGRSLRLPKAFKRSVVTVWCTTKPTRIGGRVMAATEPTTRAKVATALSYRSQHTDAGSTAEWAVVHKEGDDPTVDPWTRMKAEKKERVQKNANKKEKNLQLASGDRLPGTIDLAAAAGRYSISVLY